MLLPTKMNTSNAGLSVPEFVKLLKSNKELILHNDDIPKTNQMSQVHALGLQTIGKGIIKLVVADQTKIETSVSGHRHCNEGVCGSCQKEWKNVLNPLLRGGHLLK